MPRDYARKSNSRARPRKHSRSRKKTGSPGWIWLIAGLMVGLFLASLNYLTKETKPTPLPAHIAKPKPTHKQLETKTSYDFYTTLANGQANKLTEDKNSKPITQYHYHYFVKIASLKHFKAADRLKAQLALQGYQVQIKAFTVNGNKWHRVIAGPFSTLAKAEDIQTFLQKHRHIDSRVIKIKED